jgi:hypothetical protein
MSYGYSPSYPARRYTRRQQIADAILAGSLITGFAAVVLLAFGTGLRVGARPAAVPNPAPTEFVMLCQPLDPPAVPVRPVAVIHEPTTVCKGMMR